MLLKSTLHFIHIHVRTTYAHSHIHANTHTHTHSLSYIHTHTHTQLATWVDESVGRVGARLERRASAWPELASETVSQLHVCELFSALLTESGKIFWWYVHVHTIIT